MSRKATHTEDTGMGTESNIDREIPNWVNSLTSEQMSKLYEIADGVLPAHIAEMSDEELLAELAS